MHWLNRGESAPGFQVIGHRGAAGLAPENTLTSFRTAIALGCPMLELDVHVVHDRRGTAHLCVIHDFTLQRTTDGNGRVSDATLAGIKALHSQGEAVPFLPDVLELLRSHPEVALNIELKGVGTGAVLAALLAELEHPSGLLVSSFVLGELEAFRAANRSTALAVLLERWRPDWSHLADALDARAVNLSNRIVTQPRVRDVVASGREVYVYTVNRKQRAAKLRDWGVQGIFTDRPDRMRPLIFSRADR
ncbi:MAG: glycerophosphodiester phosphodiesterase family protein [Pseudomonadota bacterium]